MTKRSLHNIGATPTRRILTNDAEWIKAEDERKRRDDPRRQQQQQRHSDIMKAAFSNPSQHWVVEEAERRRLAEQTGRERLQKLQSRPTQPAIIPSGYNPTKSQPGQSVKEDLYKAEYDMSPVGGSQLYHTPPTHVMEHTEAPTEKSRPHRPIPDAIKQTLLQRTMAPKSPRSQQAPSSPNYPPYGPAYVHQQSPSSQYPNQSPSQYPEDYRYPQSVPYTGPSQGYPPVTAAPAYYQDDQQQHTYDPKVPPAKPPRSLPVDEGGSRAEVVSVSGHQMCSHCDQQLGEGPCQCPW